MWLLLTDLSDPKTILCYLNPLHSWSLCIVFILLWLGNCCSAMQHHCHIAKECRSSDSHHHLHGQGFTLTTNSGSCHSFHIWGMWGTERWSVLWKDIQTGLQQHTSEVMELCAWGPALKTCLLLISANSNRDHHFHYCGLQMLHSKLQRSLLSQVKALPLTLNKG